VTGKQVHQNIGGVLLLTLEVGDSFSQFSEWTLQCKLLAYILSILSRIVI